MVIDSLTTYVLSTCLFLLNGNSYILVLDWFVLFVLMEHFCSIEHGTNTSHVAFLYFFVQCKSKLV